MPDEPMPKPSTTERPAPGPSTLESSTPGSSTLESPPAAPRPTLGRILGPGPSQADLMDALRTVVDPELGLNIVDLGLVYDARVEDGRARIRMTTTTPACPIGAYLVDEIRWALLSLDGVVDVEIDITHDPPWSPDRMSDLAKALLGWTR